MKNKEKLVLVSILAVTLVLAFYIIFTSIIGNKNNKIQTSFQTLTNNQKDIEFQVTPLSANEFQIVINTHYVDLDFDLTKISTLYDDLENSYKTLRWEGSEPGGHHREGILKFPPVNTDAKSIKLVIIDSTTRDFNWNLR